jgi:hypothetical protein
MESERARAEFKKWACENMLCDPTGNLKTQAAYFAWKGWEAACREERKRIAEIAKEVAKEVGGSFWDTHRLNTALLTFMKRLSALDEEVKP